VASSGLAGRAIFDVSNQLIGSQLDVKGFIRHDPIQVFVRRAQLGGASFLCLDPPKARTCRKPGRSQPVGATPSDMNSFSKGCVYGTRKTEQAFDGAEDRHVAALEGWRVIA